MISTDNPILITSYRTKCGIWISHMTPNTEHRTTTTNHQKKVVRNSFSAGGPSGRDAHVFLSTEHIYTRISKLGFNGGPGSI